MMFTITVSNVYMSIDTLITHIIRFIKI